MLTDGTSLCSCLGSASGGARVRVGPKTSARLADVILLSELCSETLWQTESRGSKGGTRGNLSYLKRNLKRCFMTLKTAGWTRVSVF